MAIPELGNFYLVGGTALALHFGHRKSIDIDLFSDQAFDNSSLIGPLENSFPSFTYRNTHNPIGLFGFINDIKVDFVKHHYHPWIASPMIADGIRLASLDDIAAMKIAAILKRGVKKDFWDIAELLQHYSVADFITHYTRKYPSQQLLISVPSAMTYFDDAELGEDPVSLKGETWEGVKKFIRKKVSEYLS